MTAANDNAILRAITARIVPLTILTMWAGSTLFALATASGLIR